MQKPSIGRIVIFGSTTPGWAGKHGAEAPAIVTGIGEDNRVDLTVFRPTGDPLPFNDVPYATSYSKNLRSAVWWHWPERVEALMTSSSCVEAQFGPGNPPPAKNG